MSNYHLRLTLALFVALLLHLILLYPSPDPIIIPLQETSYSVVVELTTEQANTNAEDAAETKDKDLIESSASDQSKAIQENLEESITEKTQDQAGSEQALIKEETRSAKVKIDSPIAKEQTTNDETTHHFNTQSKQENSKLPKEVAGVKDSEIERVTEDILEKEQTQMSEVVASKEKTASEFSEASSQDSVKTEEAIEIPELTATEQYEAQVRAWITSKSRHSITTELSKAPTISATWWRNGTVIFATIKESSGNPHADEAAKRNVLSASPLPRIPDHIEGKEYTLDITLNYF